MGSGDQTQACMASVFMLSHPTSPQSGSHSSPGLPLSAGVPFLLRRPVVQNIATSWGLSSSPRGHYINPDHLICESASSGIVGVSNLTDLGSRHILYVQSWLFLLIPTPSLLPTLIY